MSTFSERLKKTRLYRKLTQKQLADLTGSTERGIQRYESGERKPNFEAISSLANTLNVPIDYLLGNGLFAQMDDIIKNKDYIIFSIKPYFSPKTLKQFSSMDDIRFVWVISSFIDKIEIDKNDNSIKVIFKV